MRLIGMMNHRVLFVIVALSLTACTNANVTAEIIETSADRIWIKKPIVTGGGAQALAVEFCTETGRTAVLESEL